MKNPAEIQEFLNYLFEESGRIESSAKARPEDADGSFNLTLTRTVANGLTTIKIVRNEFNVSVPPGDEVNQFSSPQLYVDRFTEFVHNTGNDIIIVDEQFENSRS